MTPLEIIQLVGGIGGPVGGVAIAAIVYAQTRKGSKDSTNVANRAVKVDEKEAHTAEINMIFEGFTASIATLTEDNRRFKEEKNQHAKELAEERAARKKMEREIAQMRQDMGVLHERVTKGERERTEMIHHITVLEKQVPNPPGPPKRPAWV